MFYCGKRKKTIKPRDCTYCIYADKGDEMDTRSDEEDEWHRKFKILALG